MKTHTKTTATALPTKQSKLAERDVAENAAPGLDEAIPRAKFDDKSIADAVDTPDAVRDVPDAIDAHRGADGDDAMLDTPDVGGGSRENPGSLTGHGQGTTADGGGIERLSRFVTPKEVDGTVYTHEGRDGTFANPETGEVRHPDGSTTTPLEGGGTMDVGPVTMDVPAPESSDVGSVPGTEELGPDGEDGYVFTEEEVYGSTTAAPGTATPGAGASGGSGGSTTGDTSGGTTSGGTTSGGGTSGDTTSDDDSADDESDSDTDSGGSDDTDSSDDSGDDSGDDSADDSGDTGDTGGDGTGEEGGDTGGEGGGEDAESGGGAAGGADPKAAIADYVGDREAPEDEMREHVLDVIGQPGTDGDDGGSGPEIEAETDPAVDFVERVPVQPSTLDLVGQPGLGENAAPIEDQSTLQKVLEWDDWVTNPEPELANEGTEASTDANSTTQATETGNPVKVDDPFGDDAAASDLFDDDMLGDADMVELDADVGFEDLDFDVMAG